MRTKFPAISGFFKWFDDVNMVFYDSSKQKEIHAVEEREWKMTGG